MAESMSDGPSTDDQPWPEPDSSDPPWTNPVPLPLDLPPVQPEGGEPPAAEPPPPREPSRVWRVLSPILGGIAGAIITVALIGDERPAPVTVSPDAAVAGDVAPVAEAVVPSIVTVLVEGAIGPSTGSGVVYDADGLIVTNDHVATAGGDLMVELAGGARFEAELVGTDPLTDLAVLRIPRSGLTPIALADYDAVRIGQPAVAVGNPLGLQGGPSVTAGVVSALDRTLQVTGETVLYGLIQTDAPITRGSSGGALVDASGALLGITTAIGVSDVGAEGLGFAVPVDLMIGVAEDLIAQGDVRHAFLGIRGETAESISDQGGLVPTGAEITSFVEGSAIEEAGARVGDVIVAVDGIEVGSIDELVSLLRRMRAGQDVTVTVARGDSRLDLDVTLGLRE